MGVGDPGAGGWHSAALGAAFVLAGVIALVAAPGDLRWQIGGAGIFLGLFLVVVLGPGARAENDTAATLQLYRGLDGVARDLRLDGPGVFVAAGAQPGLAVDRVFVAARPIEPDGAPLLDGGTTVYTGSVGGIALDPPGRTLLDDHESRLGIRLAGASFGELPVLMGSFVAGDRLVRAVSYRKHGARVTIRYRHTRQGELCRVLRGELPGVSRQLGCPVCSALVLALSRALRRPVRLDAVRDDGGETVLEVTTPA